MENLRAFAIPVAVVLAAAILAGAMTGGQRYTLQMNGSSVWRADRLTGQVVACGWNSSTPITCQQVLPTTADPFGKLAPR